MKLACILFLALTAAGCLAYHSSRTENLNAEVVAEQERRIAELERQMEDLRKEYVAAIEKVALLTNRPTGPVIEPRVPVIVARVTAIDTETNVVTLSVGYDDGVRQGYEFTVYVGDRYVAKVEVELVRDSWCQGSSKRELQAKPIEVGHEARTGW